MKSFTIKLLTVAILGQMICPPAQAYTVTMDVGKGKDAKTEQVEIGDGKPFGNGTGYNPDDSPEDIVAKAKKRIEKNKKITTRLNKAQVQGRLNTYLKGKVAAEAVQPTSKSLSTWMDAALGGSSAGNSPETEESKVA